MQEDSGRLEVPQITVMAKVDSDDRVVEICKNWEQLLRRSDSEMVGHRMTDHTLTNSAGQHCLSVVAGNDETNLVILSQSEIPGTDSGIVWRAFCVALPECADASAKRDALDESRSAILVQAPDWTILTVEGAWTELTGFPREETVGFDLLEFLHPDDRALSAEFRPRLKKSTRLRSNVVRFRTKDGKTKTLLLASRISGEGAYWKNTITISDISKLAPIWKRLHSHANRDELTKLLSRRGLQSSFADRSRREDLGLLLVDCDDFKSVNDQYGHDQGDRLLQKFAITLEQFAGRTGHAARLGGDEMVVLIPCSDLEVLAVSAANLRDRLAGISLEVDGREVQRGAAVGYALLPASGDFRAALKSADIELLRQKRVRVDLTRCLRLRER
jgi:diguanylate cyclase (GGDEF)-like protein/PAS domain S-box-containing protein